eukprot:gene7231-14757_t
MLTPAWNLFLFSTIAKSIPLKLTTTNVPKSDVNVWSLCTLNSNSLSTNMNIITYANPVAIKPEPLWTISLYKGTLSHENFLKRGWGLLQLLDNSLIESVQILGKSSGRYVDKLSLLHDKGIRTESIPIHHLLERANETNNFFTIDIICKCHIYVYMQRSHHDIVDVGDHDLILCKALDAFTIDDNSPNLIKPLSTQALRDAKLI